MNLIEAYKFCPRCTGEMNHENENLLVCKICKFNFYVNPSPTNGAIIENEEGKLLLTKRKFPPREGFWDLPGGFMNRKESFEESLKREIKEELGVEISIEKIIGAYADEYEYQNIQMPVLFISASAKIIKGKIKVSDDVSEYKFFDKNEVLKQNLGFTCVEKALKDYLSHN